MPYYESNLPRIDPGRICAFIDAVTLCGAGGGVMLIFAQNPPESPAI